MSKRIMSSSEKETEIKLSLISHINDFLNEEFWDDHEFGWMPEDVDSLMAESAFNVLKCVKSTNEFLKKEGLIE